MRATPLRKCALTKSGFSPMHASASACRDTGVEVFVRVQETGVRVEETSVRCFPCSLSGGLPEPWQGGLA
eukprot:1831164-Rhodomonas_salina.2